MRRTVRAGLRGVLAIGVVGIVTAQAGAGPTTDFTVTGDVVAPATYDLATLGSLPPTTETSRREYGQSAIVSASRFERSASRSSRRSGIGASVPRTLVQR